MIEPRFAERLGFCTSFQKGDRAAVERALIQMRSLGTRHLRVRLTENDCADDTWVPWLLGSLSNEFDVLPCIDLSVTTAHDNDVGRLLRLGGDHFSSFELIDAGAELALTATSLRHAASIATEFGKSLVFTVDAATSGSRLRALASQGVLVGLTAIGLCGECGPEAFKTHRQLLQACNPQAQLWLTQAGYSTWRHQLAGQAQAFLDAVSSEADRIYWRALSDDAECDTRDRNAHFGLEDVSGRPKLLGRLLASGGVAAVERVVAQTRALSSPALAAIRPVLVTGGAGFIGANLADRLAKEGNHVVIYDALAREGVERNLRWLARRHPSRISFVLGDLRDEAGLTETASAASAVFHLAGQVAVTTSMVEPLADFDVNARGTIALLDALRRNNPDAPLVFASTNKVYGDLTDIVLVRDGDHYVPHDAEIRAHGVGETRPLCFHTPYGCSKGTADQYVLDYAHSFGLQTAVLRMSCIYGERQLGTEDQGWVAHFLLRAIAGEPLTIYGDGRQVRDILYVGDAVDAYMAAWANIDTITGRAYNLGGGPANAISLLQLIEHIELLLGRRIDVEFSAWRPGDQRYFVADTSTIRHDLSLPLPLDWRIGLSRLAEHFGAVVETPSRVAAL